MKLEAQDTLLTEGSEPVGEEAGPSTGSSQRGLIQLNENLGLPNLGQSNGPPALCSDGIPSPLSSSEPDNLPTPPHLAPRPPDNVSQPSQSQPHSPRHSPPILEVEYDSDDSESNYEPPRASMDPPPLRLAYLNAMSDHIVRKYPVDHAETTLRNTLDAIELCNTIPKHITPLTTLKSVRRHLGLSTSAFLLKTPVCSECYKPYTFDEVAAAELPATCIRTDPRPCAGVYMKLVQKKRGTPTPKPAKLVLFTKIIPALRRMLMRPSFVRLLAEGAALNQLDRPPDVLYDACDGLGWKRARIGLRRVFKQDGTVADEPITLGSDMAVSDLGYGLFGALNIDWFSVSKKRTCGAIYLAIMNIPRHARFHVHNVILACVIPGPKEPSLEDLNFVLQPIVESFKKLYAGVAMKVYNGDLPPVVHPVHMDPLFLGADVPARAKGGGVPFHNHEHGFGCNCADCHRADVNHRKAYQYQSFKYVDEYDVLAIAKRATTSTQARDQISRDYGIRWSALFELPGWMPYGSAPFDPMHCLYLGISHDFWCEVIEAGYMLSSEQKQRFNDALSSLEWPSQIGRLPSPVTGSMDRNKADEWRRLVSVLPFLLWLTWRSPNDTVSAFPPNIPPQTSNKPKFKRDCQALWNCATYLTVSLRLFTSWIAYLPDIDRARDYMQYFCEGLLRLEVPLKPNHHYSMHLPQYFRLLGPCYSWWLFPYERFNGILEKIKRNGHPDDTATTMAKWWVRCHLLHDLLENLPEDATDKERAVLRQLHTSYEDRGTLLSMTQSVYGGTPVVKPSLVPQHFLNIRGLDNTGAAYSAVLKFAQSAWPHLHLISDIDFRNPHGRFFPAQGVAHPLQFVHCDSWRYGCVSSSRTTSDRYAIALIDNHHCPVKLVQHLQLALKGEDPIICSLVHQLDASNIPPLPWDLHAEELGYYVTNDDIFGPIMAISPQQLVSPVVTGSFTMCRVSRVRLRILIVYDRSGHEIFEEPDIETEEQGGH